MGHTRQERRRNDILDRAINTIDLSFLRKQESRELSARVNFIGIKKNQIKFSGLT
ncbi:MAG: hypothetical protein HQK99_17855 [Nitrospirae bacterium]|nr:hypothetical protein [Nitrospirota bacterium]